MIDLYTAATPNGRKISIMLEECEAEYNVYPISFDKKEQKSDSFIAMNPNGRIPVIQDADNNNFTVFESGAILIYLAEKYGKFLPADSNKRSQVLQWLMFQMGGVGPMQGQAHVFVRYAPEPIPYAIERYQTETRRLYEVYEAQLSKNEFICGELSIADFATFPWVHSYEWAKVDISDLENLQRWLATMEARPAVKRGLLVPEENKSQEAVKQGKGMLVNKNT